MQYDPVELKNTFDGIHQHGTRVGCLAYDLSRQLELPDNYWFLHYIAGRWHDYGKLSIPLSILNKPAQLDIAEWEIMKKHPIYSYSLTSLCGFGIYIKKAILYHHENYCGTGYPFGLSKKAIPLSARILRICDVFDALTEDRVYRQKFSYQNALAIMDEECANGKLDYDVYSVFKVMIMSQIRNKSTINKIGICM